MVGICAFVATKLYSEFKLIFILYNIPEFYKNQIQPCLITIPHHLLPSRSVDARLPIRLRYVLCRI